MTERIVLTHTVDCGSFGEIEFELRCSFSPGRDERLYMPNGDPGYPAEDPELDIEHMTYFDGQDRPHNCDWMIPLLPEDTYDDLLTEAQAVLDEADPRNQERENDFDDPNYPVERL